MSQTLAETRRAIRPLLNEQAVPEAMAAYYAFYHPDNRTAIVTCGPEARPSGYVALSRTGMDLFRPLVTMRLPRQPGTVALDLEGSIALLYGALPAGQPVIIHTPSDYLPLLRAIVTIDREQPLRLLKLDRHRFQPVINIFVSQEQTPDGLSRFVIRQPPGEATGEVVASAGINWQSPRFADVAVNTQPAFRHRGYGYSALAALVQHLITTGRTPLYQVAETNVASLELARRTGFVDSLARNVLLEGSLKPRPPQTNNE